MFIFTTSRVRERVGPLPADLQLLMRPDRRAASRAHLLVVPSVVCANAVSREIAARVPGAVAVTHQHGCAQVGDDATQTSASLERLARHPNAWATLVVSLGCETLQGAELAARLRADGLCCELVGIQAEGGSAATVEAGVRALESFPPAPDEREPASRQAPIAVAYLGPHEELAAAYSQLLRATDHEVAGPVDASSSPVLTAVELSLATGALAVVLVGNGLVSAPVLTPLLAVATDGARFRASEGEFDLLRPSEPELVDAVLATLGGEPTASERRGDASFSVRRTLVTL